MKKTVKKGRLTLALMAVLALGLAVGLSAAADGGLPTDVVMIDGAAPETDETGSDGVRTQSPSAYKKWASKGGLALYADPESGCFAVENTHNRQVWWSVPQDLERDTLVKGKNKVNLQSLLILEYFDPVSNVTDSVGSYAGAVQRGGVEIRGMADGIRIAFDFTGLKIRLAMDVVLEEGAFLVTVPTDSIEEYGPNYLSGIQMLPSLGAGFADEEGWLFVPDGSGAVAHFNNGRSGAAAYSAEVYGKDANQSVVRQTEITQSIRLPVFGIKKQDGALFGVITQSDGNALISASVSGKKSMFNTVNPQFVLRRVDQYDMGQSTGQSRMVNLYSTAALSKTPMQVRYTLLDGEKASLGGMAETCRAYYESLGLLHSAIEGAPPVYIDLLGAVFKKVPVAGIPADSELPVTDFSEAAALLEGLRRTGLERPVVRYENWNSDAVKGRVCDDALPSGKLGGNRAFRRLLETGTEIFPDTAFTYVRNWQIRYGKNSYAAKSIKNVPTTLYEHDIATFFADSRFPQKWLLSPLKLGAVGAKFLTSYQKLSHPFIDMGDTASVLYSDYSVRTHTRDDSKTEIAALYRSFHDAGLRLMITQGNAYAAVYAEHILDAPAVSSRYDMLDESVPFYHMVFHGSKYLGSEAVNHAADPGKALLRAVQTGSLLHYSFIAPANRGNLEGTVYDGLYSADWTYWAPRAAEQYGALKAFYERTLSQTIRDFRYLADGVSVTVYEDGSEAVVNFTGEPFVYRERTIEPNGYCLWTGKEGQSE